nr:CidA/LrgA family protein [Polaromonas sp.]
MPALRWQRVREPVNVCADFMVSHLSLLFVPVGAGVMVIWHWSASTVRVLLS